MHGHKPATFQPRLGADRKSALILGPAFLFPNIIAVHSPSTLPFLLLCSVVRLVMLRYSIAQSRQLLSSPVRQPSTAQWLARAGPASRLSGQV